MNKQGTPASIDEYIGQFSPSMQEKLEQLRQIIIDAAPEATETISYQMPAFQYYGNLVYFAACKNHIGFYPTSSGIKTFKRQLESFKTTTGTVHLPLDTPLPVELITQIVTFRASENKARHAAKLKNLPR